MADFVFKSTRGARWRLTQWNAKAFAAQAAEATRRGTDDISKLAYEHMVDHHPWENRTGQTEAAMFWQGARYEAQPQGNYVKGPHIWGEWGIRDRPRAYDEDEEVTGDLRDISERRPLTTMDVAMFLEFGTHNSDGSIRMEKRPFIYPAWDATKYLLPLAIKIRYAELSLAAPSARGLRRPLGPGGGRFASLEQLILDPPRGPDGQFI